MLENVFMSKELYAYIFSLDYIYNYLQIRLVSGCDRNPSTDNNYLPDENYYNVLNHDKASLSIIQYGINFKNRQRFSQFSKFQFKEEHNFAPKNKTPKQNAPQKNEATTSKQTKDTKIPVQKETPQHNRFKQNFSFKPKRYYNQETFNYKTKNLYHSKKSYYGSGKSDYKQTVYFERGNKGEYTKSFDNSDDCKDTLNKSQENLASSSENKPNIRKISI